MCEITMVDAWRRGRNNLRRISQQIKRDLQDCGRGQAASPYPNVNRNAEPQTATLPEQAHVLRENR